MGAKGYTSTFKRLCKRCERLFPSTGKNSKVCSDCFIKPHHKDWKTQNKGAFKLLDRSIEEDGK